MLLRAFGLFVVAVTPGLFWDFVGERGGRGCSHPLLLSPALSFVMSSRCHFSPEQKHSAGTLQEGGGSDFQCYMEKKKGNCLQGLT